MDEDLEDIKVVEATKLINVEATKLINGLLNLKIILNI